MHQSTGITSYFREVSSCGITNSSKLESSSLKSVNIHIKVLRVIAILCHFRRNVTPAPARDNLRCSCRTTSCPSRSPSTAAAAAAAGDENKR